MKNIDGVVVLNKPTGMSSMTAVKKVQRILDAAKAGHLGTLDPYATGVLPIALGKATKLFESHLKDGKTYRAIFKFGVETDTLDSEGVIVNQDDKTITEEQVKTICPSFVGKIDQMPPKYSAKKLGGKKAYELARDGKEVVLTPKQIEIFSCEYISMLEENIFLIEIKCSSGTYMRSLCRDMANSLNTFGTMVGLVRTRSGEYAIQDSVTLEQINSNIVI